MKVLVLLTLLISFNLSSKFIWRINKLPGGNFKITNQDDILNSLDSFFKC